MKKLLAVLTLSVLLFAYARTQEISTPIPVQNTENKIGGVNATGFSIFIPRTTKKNTEKSWKNYVKESSVKNRVNPKHQFEYKSARGEQRFLNISIPEIFAEPIDVYTAFASKSGGVKMTVFFKKNKVFIGPRTDEKVFESARIFVSNFTVLVFKELQSDEIKKETIKLSKLEKNLKSIKKEKDDFDKSIAKIQKEKTSTEIRLRSGTADQNIIEARIKDMKRTLNNLEKKTDAYEAYKKQLEDDENTLKKIKSSNQSFRNQISKQKKQIAKFEELINLNQKIQTEKKAEIEQQSNQLNNQINKLSDIQ